jgi:putative transposase
VRRTNDDPLSELVMERMLAGVATRRHARVNEPRGDDLEADARWRSALTGTKVPVGLWLGDTENKTIVTALLADLVARGLSADGGLIVVVVGP